MRPSGYVYLTAAQNGVYIETTEIAVVESLLGELQKILPKAKVSTERPNVSVLSGVAKYRATQLNSQDNWVGLWLLKQLVGQGWEVFRAETSFALNESRVYHLRPRA